MVSNHFLGINDHQNSIQALGNAIEKGAMFEWKDEMIYGNDIQQ